MKKPAFVPVVAEGKKCLGCGRTNVDFVHRHKYRIPRGRRLRVRNVERDYCEHCITTLTATCAACFHVCPLLEFHFIWVHQNYLKCSTICAKCSRRAGRIGKRSNGKSAMYRITRDAYLDMLATQKGACAICKKSIPHELRVDHCHRGGHVRGLLCNKCNLGLGSFNDDPDRLRSAIEYLRTPSAAQSLFG
jgi:hypothetical protein